MANKHGQRIVSRTKEMAIMANPVARAMRAVKTSSLGMYVSDLMKPASQKGDQAFAHLRRPQKPMHPMRSGPHRKSR